MFLTQVFNSPNDLPYAQFLNKATKSKTVYSNVIQIVIQSYIVVPLW